MSNRRSFAKSCLDRSLICIIQVAFNRIGTGQRLTIISLAVGLGRNRQWQRIVDRDLVAIFADSNCLAGIVAIYCKILFLIFSYWSSCILSTYNLFSHHIVCHCSGGALQVVMYSNRCLVQLEPSIVCSCLVNSIGVLGGNKFKIVPNFVCMLVLCVPTHEYVIIGGGYACS